MLDDVEAEWMQPSATVDVYLCSSCDLLAADGLLFVLYYIVAV